MFHRETLSRLEKREKKKKEGNGFHAVMLSLHVLKDSVGDWDVQCTVLLVLARKHEWFHCFQRGGVSC